MQEYRSSTTVPPGWFALTLPTYSYMLGFMQMDGNLSLNSRNRGKFQLEISKKDQHILKEFQKLIPYYSVIYERTRTTNFKLHHSVTLRVCNKGFRDIIMGLGIPAGKKCYSVKVPAIPYSEIDYWRGVIDADGSVGRSSKGIPFITLTTKSEHIKDGFSIFLSTVIGYTPNIHRNKRDKIYNFTVANRNAIKLAELLYYDGCLCLQRKKRKARLILKTLRSEGTV